MRKPLQIFLLNRGKMFCLAAVIIACAEVSAFACSCAGERPACQQYWEASAVFIGTVIESHSVTVKEGDYERQMRLVRISLDESFRGVDGAEVEVLTGFGGGDCGFGFRQTQQYLVYAYRSDTDRKLYTSICTRTRTISEAEKDLAYIRGLSKAKPGATISGEVVKYIRNAEGGLSNQPLPGLKVRMAGPGKYEAVTGANGKYSIGGIIAGEYTVSVAAPQGLAAREPDRKIEVADRGCAEIAFWLESNARLSGRVLNPEGLPVPKAEIFMIDADKERYRGHWDAAYADDAGTYSFKLIPPGRYVLIVRYDGTTSQTRPFPTIYYPGVGDQSQAQVFTVREGEIIDNYDLKVPPLPAEYDVKGTVTWADRRPVKDAFVEYMWTGEPVVHSVKAGDEGRFSFKAYEGLKLTVRASVRTEQSKTLYSNLVEIVVGSANEPLKLVFSQ